MVESKRHEEMKRAVATVLSSEGYEIETEKKVDRARIDVFAESLDETLAVEIGDLGNERARYLENECDRLVHIPYERLEPTDDEKEDKSRTNININPDVWDEFGELVGKRSRSGKIRQMMNVYVELFGGE